MLTEKDYCDYETCVALEELGFSQYHSDRVYAGEGGVWTLNFDGEPNYNEGELIRQEDMFGVPRDGNEVAAPLLYEAQKFLREEKSIYVTVGCPQIMNEGLGWSYEVCDKPWNGYSDDDCLKASGGAYDSYEEALSEGVREAVKILKEE